MTDLEKIDVLRERMGLGYAAAKAALEAADGDLIQALIAQEREQLSAREQMWQRGGETWDNLKDSATKAVYARIRLKKGEKALFTLPAPVGALGLAGALVSTPIAVLGLVGTAVALANNCSLEIDRQGSGSDKSDQEQFDNSQSVDI